MKTAYYYATTPEALDRVYSNVVSNLHKSGLLTSKDVIAKNNKSFLLAFAHQRAYGECIGNQSTFVPEEFDTIFFEDKLTDEQKFDSGKTAKEYFIFNVGE